ncbi:hypothetical protein O9Z70_07880 [Devosia sp. YIM 151766]|uniref:hypothetical protein n=1 Tax=Devosia sp. YIM 151766 TaxID=3017325 RepID=UPI00255CA781|nr:hypothetical protein [Devosia sp. YIM 151766]WIY54426.1 hypothetical protein O9Z70_07880 [Devosia sp. YIM 151766]
MAIRRIDFGKLTIMDYAVGVVLTLVATAVVTGFEMAANLTLPSFAASVAGAAIGIVAWFTYLLKRKS